MASALVPDPSSSGPRVLRLVTNSAASRLLQLPRELRDTIYRYVLIEPRLWERRHKSGCSKYNPPITYEYPPVATPDFVKDEEDPDGWGWFSTHSCAKRLGVSLLSVNKQTHKEASPIFWDNNAFCYETPRVFTEGVEPPSLLPKIQKLSFMNFREDEGRDVLLRSRESFQIMAQMPNLRELEVQQSWLRDRRIEGFLALKALKVVTVLHLTPTYLAFEEPWEHRIFTALAWDLEVPQCDDKVHREYQVFDKVVCQPCLEVLQQYERMSRDMPWRTIYGRRGIYGLLRKLERLDIAWTTENYRTMLVKLKKEDGNLEARIWGLPTSSIAQHERAYLKEQRAKKGPNPVAKERLPVRYVSEEGEESLEARKRRPAKSYRCEQQRFDQGREAKVQARLENRAEEAKDEAARKRSASKIQAKLKAKGERELQDEKKAAMKREGRR